jgi:hypothetical protein
MSRAILRADGVFLARPAGFDDSSRRRRVAHSATTRRDPWNPCIRSRRQSSAPFRQPPVQSASSVSAYGSRMLTRLRKTSSPPPRAIRRTVWRARLSRRVICLSGVPCSSSRNTASTVFLRCWKFSHRLRSAQLSSAGSMSSVADDLRMACMFWRTTSRKLALAFSKRCQRSAICMAWGAPLDAASP